jgi:hypothetical protein
VGIIVSPVLVPRDLELAPHVSRFTVRPPVYRGGGGGGFIPSDFIGQVSPCPNPWLKKSHPSWSAHLSAGNSRKMEKSPLPIIIAGTRADFISFLRQFKSSLSSLASGGTHGDSPAIPFWFTSRISLLSLVNLPWTNRENVTTVRRLTASSPTLSCSADYP